MGYINKGYEPITEMCVVENDFGKKRSQVLFSRNGIAGYFEKNDTAGILVTDIRGRMIALT